MSASWDSDLSSIIEKTNNNLKLLRKIGDKPQVRSPDVSVTAAGHPSARPRAFVGAQDDAGSTSSRGSARPRAFIRGDDDTSSMGSHGSARPKAYVRGDDDTGSMGSHSSARPKAFIRTDDDSGSVSSRASARPKAFIRPDDDAGSASSRASARPKAFIRADDDSGSVSSRASARPKAFIRGDDDTGSMSSRSSARPKAFVRGDDDTGSMNSNQGLGRSRLDSGSSSGRPHVGIAGGGGLTAAMLQQHRATATGGSGLGMADLGAQRSRFDLDETRSMSGVSASRLRRPLGANGRVPHAHSLGASMGPRIRVPDADIPSDTPNHVVDEIKKSLETHFASRNGAVDKKVADLRTDVAGLTTQTSSLSSQISELRDAVLVSANSKLSANAPSVSDPKIIASVQANVAAIARLEEHSADLLGRKVSVDRELTEIGSRVKSLSSATMKISTLEDNIEALVANRQKQEQGLFKLADRVQLMHRQMGSLVDMKAVENLLSIRLTREFREMEDRLAQNVIRMAEKMEQKVQSMEKQSSSQRQESLAALKNDLTDDIQRLQSSALRKSDLLPLQNAQTQSKEDLAQLSNALDRQEKKLQDAKLANSTLRDELADARTELNKALQSQQRSASALMEEKLEQITTKNKEKSTKFDDQLSELAKKQKKLEEATKTLQETMTQVKAEAGQRWGRSSADREEENDKLRQRLARSVAELEALATTKTEVERRFASEEQQFQSRLKELRTTLIETEKQKEAQRLELMQKLQEESKLMGVAQGKNSLLETLLAREKAENEEKNELVRKSKKEVAEVRDQIRNLESEKEKKVRQLTSELQAKQTQVGLLTKTLKRIETASAKMLDLSKREAKTVRRVKATKEHELFIAQLKLKEMERVAQALQNGDEMKKQAALTAASTEERKELEKLLLESQLEKDELKQELEEMSDEFNAAKESQKVIMEDTITKLSSDYDDKISELKQQIADKEQAMRHLRDTLVEKSNLDALEDELAALKDEKNDLLEQIQRAQIEHERVTLKTETNLRLEHATEFAAMKSKFEERISDLEGAKSELEATKATIAELEKELEKQEALHQREVSTLTNEIKEARSKIDECTAQILDLEETKTRLEGEVSQMEANIGGASAEKEEELEAIKSQMQSEVEKLRVELAEVSSTLEDKQTQLKEAKQSDENNRQRLVEMAMAQEEMQSRYVSQIDSLSLKLNQERESSRAREQDLEDTIDKLNADVKTLKTETSKELEAARSELTDQMTELTTTLKASQHREQQLQSRLKRILEELVQAANASGENEVAEDAVMSDDEAITHHLDTLYATHRRTAHELERLQAEYELTVKQAAADSATAQELDNQVKEHETQIKELESVVEQLREELKEQYHKSAIIAKGSDEFSDEMASLREEKRQLERQLQEEEKDREKREVSYQRRTEMKEREVEELRTENKTLTAAVAAVREKIRAVESVKYNDLGELQNKLKDLEERTAALQPDEKNVANLEQDFTATRQEIVTLTAEVQSLYQKLTACCGIVEWSELRASVFDEEEKLTRVRSENARELAKVQSVEQEVLTNAEFLNALLVAHGSTGGDGDLLNDFRWMQKYASIAPEIVEKLRKVESRLRDAVLDLHDDSASLFPAGAAKASEVAALPPNSQKSAVDGAAIALALEKAKEDYFSETSDGAQDLDDEDMKLDADQPDVEQEGLVDQDGEGASHENVDDVEGQDSIGAMSHEESGTCADDDDLVVAEHVVHDEQETSREDEELSVKQDRNDDVDGLESSVDRKIEDMTKTQSQWSSVGLREDDDMDEVERPRLERSSKQVNPRIDNECDDSDEFATTIVHVETEEQSAAVSDADETKPEEVDSNPEFVEQGELSDAEEDERSDEADDLDPLDESSFDNAMISALEGRESYSTHDVSSHTTQRYEVEADDSDSEDYVVQDAIAEDSCEESMDNGDESSDTNDAGVYQTEVDTEVESAAVELPPAAQNSELEESFDGDAAPDSEVSFDRVDEREVDHVGSALAVSDTAVPVEHSSSSIISGELADHAEADSDEEEPGQHGESNVLEESSSSAEAPAYAADVRHTLEGSTSSLERDTLADNALEDSAGENNASEESLQSVERGAGQQEEENAPEETSSTLRRAENVKLLHLQQDNALEGSSTSLDGGTFVEDNELEQAAPSIASGDDLNALEESTSSMQNVAQRDEGNALNDSVARVSKAKVEQLDASNSLEESAPSMDDDTAADGLHSYETNAFEESASSVDNTAVAHDEDGGSALEESPSSLASGLREDCSENSLNRASSRHGYADSVAMQSDDDDVHVDRGESSFDADMQSDIDDEAGISYEAEVSTQPVKYLEEEAEDECSEEQLRAAEHSLDRPSAPEDDDEAGDNVESAPAPTTTLRMEDDESSEEETMPVQSQPILSTNLSRFGMGTRRLNLEEDDEMDEIERLLLDQSASSKQKRQQQFTRPTTTTENDDKFGESSLQSRGGDDDEFGEDSIRSREDNEIEEISDTSRDNTVDERSIRIKESSTSLEKDTLAGEYEEANTSEELSSTMTRAALEESAVEEKSLEESATSLKNVETKHVYEDNELEQSAASIASGDMEESTSSVQSILKLELDNSVVRMDQADIEQLNASNSFDESASNLDNDVAGDNLHTYETDALEHSTSSLDNTAVEYQGGDGSVLEESSSSLASGSREYYSRNSPDRVSSRRTNDDPLALQSDDDDIHANRDAVVISRPNPLESSFDADMQSDLDDEASASYDAELSTQPVMNREEVDDEWLEAERSMRDDHETADTVESAPAPTMTLRMEDDESSEEETMTQPTFSTILSRFGMGVRRLNLEEDDEMDEVERLLLDQSASSMEKTQQQPRLSSILAATDDDDEFGESSLQSRGGDEDKFGDDSIRSREDDEFEDVSATSRDNEFDERSVQHDEETRRQQDNRFTGLTRNQANDDDGEFGELSREPHGEDVEFGEDSIRSREDNEFEDELARSRYDTVNERSVQNQGSLASMERDTLVDQDKEGNASEELSSAMRRDALTDSGDEENSLDESATGLKNVKAIPHREEDVLERSSTRLNEGALADSFDEDNELEQSAASIASGHQAEDFTALEESTSSTRSVEQHVEGKALNDPLEESASNLDNDTAADDLHTNELEHSTSSIDNTAVAFEDGEGSVLEESSSSLASGSRRYYSRNSPDRASSRHTYDDPLALQSDDDDIQADHGVAVISRPNPLENSFDADMQSDLDEEASAELSTRPIKHQEEAEDERSEEQLRAAGHSPERPLVSEDNRNADVRASTMRLCLEDDESSEEETMTVQTQPTFSASQNRFGMGVRRLNLEEDDEMDEIERLLLDQSASSMEKRQQQPRLSSRPAATDDEFGESPLQSRDDDEFGEDSIRSREDNEFEDVSAASRPRDNAFGERSISNDEGRRQQANRFTRPLSSNATDEDDGEFGRRSIQSHEGGEAGESPIRFRAHEFGDSFNRSRLHNNEFGIIRSRSQEEDDFGEASIESRGGKSPEVSNNSRLHEEGNFGGSSETNKLSQALSSLRGESEFGRARISTYPREEVEFGETSARSNSHVEDEFGDTSERSGGSFDEDDFGEISIPLQEDTAILPAPSRFLNVREVEHSTRPTNFSDRGMVYQEGLMNSPMKSSATTTAARDDSASEAEHDYMDDSFDLDESLEEEEDNDERDV
ncbi:hypothetical protein GQ600_5579 [Phytophthora cactorum]|nr:hypothetical protein GQ600_5579 [Phytophthora cactorum]